MKKLEIEYYDNGNNGKGLYKFKIYTLSIYLENFPEMKLNFMYFPTVKDVIEILSNSIYPTIAIGRDTKPWQDACIEKIKLEGIPEIDKNTMTISRGGVSIDLMHAYIK